MGAADVNQRLWLQQLTAQLEESDRFCLSGTAPLEPGAKRKAARQSFAQAIRQPGLSGGQVYQPAETAALPPFARR